MRLRKILLILIVVFGCLSAILADFIPGFYWGAGLMSRRPIGKFMTATVASR